MRMLPALLLATTLAFPATVLAQSARLAALGEEMIEREYDFAPLTEAYREGAGPRAGRPHIDIAPGYAERRRGAYRDLLQRMDNLSTAGLADAERTTLEVMRRRARDQMALLDHPHIAVELLTPTRGIASNLLYLLSNAQPFETEADFDNWAARMHATAGLYASATAALREAAKQGWTTPQPLVRKALAQLESLDARTVEQGPLWRVVAKYPKEAAADKRAAFEKRYRAILEETHQPALRRFIAFVRDDYLPSARTTAGIGSLPGGATAYRNQIRANTTLDLAPEELHALGLAEVARVRAKLLEVARPLGFKGEMKDFAAWLESNPSAYPFTAAEEVLAYLRKVHARVVPELPRIFHRLPRSGFEIRQTDPLVAASASATYSQPTPDGKRPGIFNIPIVDPRKISSVSLPALLMHEGMPGHHLDVGRKVELDLPRVRKSGFSVYSEGWGLYAEGLGQEIGAYPDAWALLGRYSGELHRAARLVVDTGMHWKGWSREDAIRYLVEERGQSLTGATVATERYMGTPGQALAYKVGELQILNLRSEAQAALGTKFDLRDFHEAVLGAGPLPMGLLRQRVESWYRTQ
jgi:uncharacterized protein (DUF885 family)